MAYSHPDDQYGRAVPPDDPVPPSRPDNLYRNLQPGGPNLAGINPNRPFDIIKLREAIDWSDRQLRSFREWHTSAVRYMAGGRYGTGGISREQTRTPLNLYNLAIGVWTRHLVSQDPRCVVTTQFPQFRVDGYELGLATNYLIKSVRLGRTLGRAVKSAIFTMGIVRVGLSSEYLPKQYGFEKMMGHPYADEVLFEDWLHDMNARHQDEWDWCGNRYRMVLEDVLEDQNNDPAVANMLKGHVGKMERDSRTDESERTSSLTSEQTLMKHEYRQHVELIDIFLPGDNLLVTIPAEAGDKPLRVREWEGPERGPYHILGFNPVPGNLMPSAPAQHLFDLQELITRLFNQLSRQGLRQKTLTLVDGAAQQDGTAQRIMDATDGQIVVTNHPDMVQEIRQGGIDPGNMQFMTWLREIFSYAGGNIDAMGGLQQQGGTLGQENLLLETSSEMLKDMQGLVVMFTQDIITDLSWYMYSDPTGQIQMVKPIKDYGDIPFTYSPGARQADFFRYAFQVLPYTLTQKMPDERLNDIVFFMTQIVAPFAPMFAEWGITFDFRRFVELFAQYRDMPEFNELMISEMPLRTETGFPPPQGGGRVRQSPVTSRNYTRTNVSAGGTQQSRDQAMRETLAKMAVPGG